MDESIPDCYWYFDLKFNNFKPLFSKTEMFIIITVLYFVSVLFLKKFNFYWSVKAKNVSHIIPP